MKNFAAALVLSVVFTAPSMIHSPPALALEWYQGGTLHDATGAAWKKASYRNRLATAGDLITVAIQKGYIKDVKFSIGAVKPIAIRAEKAISMAFQGNKNDREKVNEVFVALLMMTNGNI